MVSFFKASCSIYWLTGIFCLAYLMGTSLYTDRFIYTENIKSAQNIQSYIMFLSIFNLCYSFVGCVFVKCNIVHIIYAILFVLPMLSVNFTFGIMGLIACKTSMDNYPSLSNMIDIAQKYFTAHENKYPIWLHHTQENANCCGVVSFLDYPSFMYTSEKNLQDALPRSCCYDSRLDNCTKAFDLRKDPKALLKDIASEYQNGIDDCNKGDGSEIKKYVIPKIKNKNSFYLLDKMKPILPNCGCYYIMKEAFDSLFGTAHFVFFIIILVLTAVMLFVYIKNWCNNRGLDSGSEHSLDTDNMSLLNISLPAATAAAATVSQMGDKKESTAAVPEKSMGLTKVNIGDTEK